jgi:capsid portal protein
MTAKTTQIAGDCKCDVRKWSREEQISALNGHEELSHLQRLTFIRDDIKFGIIFMPYCEKHTDSMRAAGRLPPAAYGQI